MGASGTVVRPWVRSILILPAILFIVGIFEWIGYAILGLDPVKDGLYKTPVQYAIGALFTLVGIGLVVRLFSRYIDKIKFKDLGFNPKKGMQQLLAGFMLGIILISSSFFLLILFRQIHWQDTNLVVGDLMAEICLFIFVAFSEELLLRGYVLNNLMQSVSRGWALIISSLMFSIIHILNPNFSWIGFCNIFLAGILLGLPYLYTRQLWFPMALHFSWNFFQGPIFGFNVSGQEMNSLINQTRVTDTIWNGGNFGFEGSALCFVMELLASGLLWWYYTQREVTSSETVVTEAVAEAEVH